MRFVLEVEASTPSMSNREHLRKVFEDCLGHLETCPCSDGTVRDSLGVVVGRWAIAEEEPETEDR